jgi:hypothetical protein
LHVFLLFLQLLLRLPRIVLDPKPVLSPSAEFTLSLPKGSK